MTLRLFQIANYSHESTIALNVNFNHTGNQLH
uniref:Uncharacterized protein n=1 Tax=Anguilla anguilla TaxID=7936 RepID=A0A0E9QWP2_ANGAN